MDILQQLELHTLAVPLCHLMQLLARAVLHSPARVAASQLQLATLAEALVLPTMVDRAEQQAGPMQLPVAESSQEAKVPCDYQPWSACTRLNALPGRLFEDAGDYMQACVMLLSFQQVL